MERESDRAPDGEARFTAATSDILKIINTTPHRAIVMHFLPEAESGDPDIINLLAGMGQRGYLCLLCRPSDTGGIEAQTHNLFYIQCGLALIPALKGVSALVLTTGTIASVWNKILPHKLIWIHIKEEVGEDYGEGISEKAGIISFFSNPSRIDEQHLSDPRGVDLGDKRWPRLSRLERKLWSNPKVWPIYANLDLRGAIAVMTCTFLDFAGSYFYSGGAERYLLDLAEICEDLGCQMIILQYGDYPWMRRFKNIILASLSRDGLQARGWILKCAREFNRVFHDLVQDRTSLNIYSAFYEAWPIAATPNIGISHGVSWDNPYSEFANAAEFWLMQQRYIDGAKACEELVSVDTNTANWLQTVDYPLGQRVKVIPNYVDLGKFNPREGYLVKRDKTIILYPRQLYSARGLYMVLAIIDDILSSYPKVEFHFIGRGGEGDIEQVAQKQIKWQDRVQYCALSMDEMPGAYQKADISLIPSIHSEGTSLSCLEAMAAGNALIATRIGGLPDLIINNYNGFLIDPHPRELKRAIVNLLENHELMVSFKARNAEVARAFSRDGWEKRWRSLLKENLNQTAPGKKAVGRVVDIILEEGAVDYAKLGAVVAPLLIEGCLVNLRTEGEPDHALCFDRIQWLRDDAPAFSPPDSTILWKEG